MIAVDVVYRNPQAGIFNKEYAAFLFLRFQIFNDHNALWLLQQNAQLSQAVLDKLKQLNFNKRVGRFPQA